MGRKTAIVIGKLSCGCQSDQINISRCAMMQEPRGLKSYITTYMTSELTLSVALHKVLLRRRIPYSSGIM